MWGSKKKDHSPSPGGMNRGNPGSDEVAQELARLREHNAALEQDMAGMIELKLELEEARARLEAMQSTG